jgi:hypothetical protein
MKLLDISHNACLLDPANIRNLALNALKSLFDEHKGEYKKLKALYKLSAKQLDVIDNI